jgi:hypothetical protein
MSSVSNKTCLIPDSGAHLFLAEKLAEKFAKVWFVRPDASCSGYLKSAPDQIGRGLEVECIYDMWKVIDKADCVAFFDCCNGGLQRWLKSKGHKVFGSAGAGEVEEDKTKFLDILKDLNLPIPKTYRAEGFKDLVTYLEGKGEKWLKFPFYRGDGDTRKYTNMRQLNDWLDDLRSRIGWRLADEYEILIQDPIESVCEVGYDGFCVNGEFTNKNILIGYESKDTGYIGKVMPETPAILRKVNDKFSDLFKRLGYQGHYSTEIRIAASGKAYFIDPTCRCPSPPGELMCEIYGNYAEAVWEIANGKMPDLKPVAPYGASLCVVSDWNKAHELCVEFPKELKKNVKLSNHMKKGPAYYVIPTGTSGWFGAVVATGNTAKEATEKCVEVAKQIKCDDMDIEEKAFDEIGKTIQSGKRFGINM